jgi:hypothetical protein
MHPRRLIDFSPQAKFWLRIALAMFLMGLLAAAGNGFGMHDMVGGFTFALGFFVLPFVAVVLGIAAFSEEYHLPRVTLWMGAAGLFASASLVASFALGLGSDKNGISASLFWYLCCFPILVVVLIIGCYFIVRAWSEAQQETAKAREGRALELIQSQGVVTLANLASEMQLPTEMCETIVQMLVQNTLLFGGFFDQPRQTVYSPPTVAAKQQQLADLIKARGEISLDDLAAELHLPRELARDWTRQLAQDHKFAGYINWDEGVFHRTAAALPVAAANTATPCPRCGAELAARAEVVHCRQCGSDIFF